jgi:hypothetical protein
MKLRDLNIIINRLRQSAKKRGIEFDLKTTDLDEIGIPISCPILGIPLKWHNGKAEDDSYSVDRIDSTRGYVKDNIQFMSMKANRAKNNLTSAELKLLSTYYK